MNPYSRLTSCVLLVVPFVVHIASASPLANIEPAGFRVAAQSAAGAPFQTSEFVRLNDDVVARIAADEATKPVADHFTFDTATANGPIGGAQTCRTFPGDPSWPNQTTWEIFDALLGGALIPTVPIASSCYDTEWGKKDSAQCANIVGNFTNPYFHESDPSSIMWPIFQVRTCMPSNNTSGKQCAVGGYPEYAIKVAKVAQTQSAINFARAANLRPVIKNTWHYYLGKSSGAGALSLWMHNLQDIDFPPDYKGPGYSGPALKLSAGVTVRQVYEAADRNHVTVTGAVSWSVGYAGGMITGGGQNPLAGIYGMAADHVVAFNVVTADGRFRTALRGGGGGTFAVVVSVVIRARPKLKVVTAGWRLDASTNGVDAFWKGTKKFFDEFLTWADAGVYSFFIMGNKPSPFLNMLSSYTKLVTPFFDYLHANNITLTTPHESVAHESLYSAYQAAWGSNSFPIGLDNSLPANRIVSRINFQDKYNETFALIKEHVSSGKHFLGFHKTPAKHGNINNAVSPAWRECAMFFVTSSNKSLDHSTPEALAVANKDLHENILQPWRDISPVSEGGGTYLNEASVMEPDWQESSTGATTRS